MKKLLCLALCLVLSLSLLAGCSNGGDAATPTPDSATPTPAGDPTPDAASVTTVEEGKLHMATNAQFPPYEMTTDDGGFEGIDVEIATAIAQKLGLELVVDDMDFTSVITAVQQGKSDIAMAGLTVRPDREENVDFTSSYATGIQVVIVTEDSDITSIEDLANDKIIGVQDGTTGWMYCSAPVEEDGYGADHVVAYPNGSTAVQALISGSVDCVVIDNEPAKAYVEANPGLKILETEFAVEDYAIGVSKDNPALLDAVNTVLEELIADGTVQSIVDKYITAE